MLLYENECYQEMVDEAHLESIDKSDIVIVFAALAKVSISYRQALTQGGFKNFLCR